MIAENATTMLHFDPADFAPFAKGQKDLCSALICPICCPAFLEKALRLGAMGEGWEDERHPIRPIIGTCHRVERGNHRPQRHQPRGRCPSP
jgi:hypothetical protein